MGLFSSQYHSIIHQALVILHVLTALFSLAMGPLAMILRKGGRNHNLIGRLYFWGMFTTNTTALILLTYRFNIFLLGVTVLTLYGAIMGYRAILRKRSADARPTSLDWAVSLGAGLSGISLIGWSVLALLGASIISLPLGPDTPLVLILLPLGFGVAITQAAVVDLKNYLRPSQDRLWWWFQHMNGMLGSYIGLTTALMVQQDGPRLPEGIAWVVWVLPVAFGTIGMNYWMNYYRARFAGGRQKAAVVA